MIRPLRLAAGLLRLWWAVLTDPVLLLSGGEAEARAAAIVLALTTRARCSELGPVVRVHPAIRALDAGRER